jgi:FkbH-like protein
VSKNNLEDARAVFATRPEMLLSWDDFSAIRVNWQDKVSNLRQIAEELGLGLDSFVFADDSPLECGYVRAALPQMQVVELGSDPSLFSERLLDTQAFDTLHISEEDRKRAAGYAAEAARKHLRSLVVDLESFLADCDLRVSIRPADRTTLHRIHQLLGKTNQFHLTLARPTREELDVAGHSGDRLFSVHLRDRFGDYGLIGVLELQPGTQVMEIANLAVSCRALGRGVEDAMVAFARESAASRGIKRLKAAWVRGPRNEQVHDYLWRVGFQGHPRSEGKVDFELAIGDGVLAYPYYIKVDTYAPTTSE